MSISALPLKIVFVVGQITVAIILNLLWPVMRLLAIYTTFDKKKILALKDLDMFRQGFKEKQQEYWQAERSVSFASVASLYQSSASNQLWQVCLDFVKMRFQRKRYIKQALGVGVDRWRIKVVCSGQLAY